MKKEKQTIFLLQSFFVLCSQVNSLVMNWMDNLKVRDNHKFTIEYRVEFNRTLIRD